MFFTSRPVLAYFHLERWIMTAASSIMMVLTDKLNPEQSQSNIDLLARTCKKLYSTALIDKS
jgi:hypothetical protein